MKKTKNFMIVLALTGLLASCSTSTSTGSNSSTGADSTGSSISASGNSTSSTSSQASSSESTVKPTSLVLSDNTLNLDLKDNRYKTLTATVLPDNATNKEIIWESSDPSVCNVQNGQVTAIKAGTSTVKVSSLADLTVYAECLVTVTDNRVASTFMAINAAVVGGKKNLTENQVGFSGDVSTLSITYTFTLENAEDVKLSAEISSNTTAYNFTDVYQLSLNGETKSTTAKTNIGTTWSDYGNVDVGEFSLPKGDNTIVLTYDKNVTGWQTFNFRSLTIWSYEEIAQTNYEENKSKIYEYAITDDKVATNGKKGADGAIGALAYGTLKIDYKVNFDSATTAVLSATLSASNAAAAINSIYKMSINGVEKTFEGNFSNGEQWGSYFTYNLGTYDFNEGSNDIVFSYDYYASEGWTYNFKSLTLETTAGVTLLDANIYVTAITLDQSEYTLNLDTNPSFKLTPTITPSDATNTSLVWSSSDGNIAKVSSDGTVTGLAIGTAVITAASALDENIKATCSVEVTSTLNHYTYNAVDDLVTVSSGTKNSTENTVGVDGSYACDIKYGLSSNAATTFELSATVSCHSGARLFTDVYSLVINGTSCTSEAIIPVGTMWTEYVTLSLGTFDLISGMNTIEFSYLQAGLTWQSYNFRDIQLATTATLTQTTPDHVAADYALSAVDDKVFTNGKKGEDGSIGAIGYTTAYIEYKVNFDFATTATLSADLSAAASSTPISSVYSLYINGIACTVNGDLNGGSQWNSYATYTLGTYSFLKGENTITLAYDWNSNTSWTYNFQKINLHTVAVVTYLDANANYLTYDAATEDNVTIEGGISKDTTNDYLSYTSYTYNKATFKVYADKSCLANLSFTINRNAAAQWKFADYFDVFVNVDADKCYRDDQLEYKNLPLNPTTYTSQTRIGDTTSFSSIDLGFVSLQSGENVITLGWNAPSAEYGFLVRNMIVGSLATLSKTSLN